MNGEVKMSTWDLAAGQHVRIVFAPGASVCGQVVDANDRFVRVSCCQAYPWSFWVRIPRRELLAAYKQLALESCDRWPVNFSGKKCVPSFV
jgi:hypothetical protein